MSPWDTAGQAFEESPASDGPTPCFTGQVKPVLYVADVEEESASLFRDRLGFELLNYTDGADGELHCAEISAGGPKFGLRDPMNEEQAPWVGHQRIYFRVELVRTFRAELVEALVLEAEALFLEPEGGFGENGGDGLDFADPGLPHPNRHSVRCTTCRVAFPT